MSYKIAIVCLIALHASAHALPPCTCTRNLQPVCGSDGETYSNPCLLECARHNGKKDLVIAKHTSCEPATPICVCTYEYKPVCGTDGQTYPNRCSLECVPGNAVASEGMCPPKPTEPQCICPLILAPVCGTDGNTYSNDCVLNCRTAKDNTLGIKHQGACVDRVKVVEPPCECTENLEPVCGTDGETYANSCLLNCQTAKDHTLGVRHQGACVNNLKIVDDAPSDQANCTCPRNLKPVCGSNGVTYGNECMLGCAGAQVSIARQGPC